MMNRASHHQCLKELRLEYLKTSSKKGRDRLLDEYDTAKTSYQRVMESKDIAENKKQELKKVCDSLNPAQLKRDTENKLNLLYKAYREKNTASKVDINEKVSVRFFGANQNLVSVR